MRLVTNAIGLHQLKFRDIPLRTVFVANPCMNFIDEDSVLGKHCL